MARQKTDVSVAVVQDFNSTQQSVARSNIGAASESAINSINNNISYLGQSVGALNTKVGALTWTKVEIDESITTEATQLFTVGHLIIGYYFDSANAFRLSMKSDDGTRYVYLADNMGYGGGYQVTDSSWTAIYMRGFTSSCQLESLIGYDCTSDIAIHFEVQFANSSNSLFDTICRYRVLE